MRVLIVDDDFLPIEQTIRELEEECYEVIHIQDADNAKEYVEAHADSIYYAIIDEMVGTRVEGSYFDARSTRDFTITGIELVRAWLRDDGIWQHLGGRLALWSIGSDEIDEEIEKIQNESGGRIEYWRKSTIENGFVLNRLNDSLGLL